MNTKLKKTSFKKGHIPWNKGKANPWAKNLPQQFKKGHPKPQNAHNWQKGHPIYNIERKGCFGKKEKHWNWQGGINLLTDQIRRCFQYRQWRSDVFTRDNFICQICGIRDGKIVADHIKAFSLILSENNVKTLEQALACEELWNINNGRTLCQNCHHKTENYGGRASQNK